MAKAVDWDRGHSPVTGTLNASYSALAVAAVGHETGLPPAWVLAAGGVGAISTAIAGASAEEPLSRGSILTRAGGWTAASAWTTWALSQPTIWSWSVVGPLMACTCGFASVAGALGRKRRRQLEREERAFEALTRVQLGREWVERFDRVCGVKGCEVLGIEQWLDEDGKETGAGFDLDIKMPEGGSSWRVLARSTDQLAADADLPEGCGIEVSAGVSRRRAIVKVQLVNALLTGVDMPFDASPLDFNEPFDIGILRDGGLAKIFIREHSVMLVGTKRTGKTNQLKAIMSRLLRMPNLLVWVIDFNGGGVALTWLQAWAELGKPGRPPIDWIAADPEEAARMANAAVRIATARKIEYQDLMTKHDTDLLPLSVDVPGIVIVTDEGAEIYANPNHRKAAEPMKEVLRIAGASGVNQINCFLRATADTTGDTIIKSQSTVRIGMRMSDEAEMSYLLGWRSGVTPSDMPDQGYGALSMDESAPANVFRGYRTLPSHQKWMVENTVSLRMNDGLDPISLKAAGEVYTSRWERAEFVFNSSVSAPKVQTTMVIDRDDSEAWSAGVDPQQAKENLRKAIEDAGGPSGEEIDEFRALVRSGGLEDLENIDPSNLPPESPEEVPEEEPDDMRDIVFGMVKAMSPDGVGVADILKALERQFGKQAPTRQTITRWLREDDRIERIAHGKYAVKTEED